MNTQASSQSSPLQIKLIASQNVNFCTECGKIFSTSCNLRNHVLTIHENMRPYKCPYPNCNKSYSIKSRLQVHTRIHTGKKPFICKECGKAFNEKGNLKTHQRFHSEQRPFQCPHCNKTYKTNGHLKDHIEIQHLKIRKFSCNFCNKTFGRISTLKAHIRTHTGEKNYKCGVEGCGKCFAEKGNMEIHYKRHLKRIEKQKMKGMKKTKGEISFSIEKPTQIKTVNSETEITRPCSNYTLYTNEFQILSTKERKEDKVEPITSVSNEIDLMPETCSNFLFCEPNEENEVNKIDLGYLDSLNELNFDFDNTFMNFEH